LFTGKQFQRFLNTLYFIAKTVHKLTTKQEQNHTKKWR